MEDYFRGLIEKCKFGELSANDILERVAKSEFSASRNSLDLKPSSNRFRSQESIHKKHTVRSNVYNASPSLNELENPRDSEVESRMFTEEYTPTETLNQPYSHRTEERVKLSKTNEEFNLQQYIEDQLGKLFDRIGPIEDKEQLEDIKRKIRLKWSLRTKKIKEAQEIRDEENFNKNCSFKPKINNSNVKTRYFESQLKSPTDSLNQECTFAPTINKRSSYIRNNSKNRIQNSLKSSIENIHESIQTKPNGLANGSVIVIEKDIYKMDDLCLENDLSNLVQNFYAAPPFPQELSPKIQIQDLQPHQEEKIEKMLDFSSCSELSKKRNSLLQRPKAGARSTSQVKSPNDSQKVIKTPVFQKNIKKVETNEKRILTENSLTQGNQKSIVKPTVRYDKKINLTEENKGISAMKESKKVNVEEFAARGERFNERRSEKLAKLEKENKEKCTFQPHISEMSRSLDKRIHDEKVSQFLVKKEERLARLREEKIHKELSSMTAYPKINKNVPASSKLNINAPLSEYVNGLREKKEVEDQFRDLIKRRKDASETIECTHRPQINEAPLYLKQDLSSTVRSFVSPKASNYKNLMEQKKAFSTQKTTHQSFLMSYEKENIYVPPLFDDTVFSETY